MSWHRVYAMFLRYAYLMRRNFDRLADAFYWPSVDLFVWGLTGLYVERLAGDSQIVVMLLTGLIFWYFIYRVQGDITVNLLEEIWNGNLVNIFVSPLTFKDWVASVMLNGLVKAIVSFSFAGVLALVLYKTNVFMLGFYMLPFAFLLMLSGWFIGFLIAGLIFRFGMKVQFLAWTLVYLFSPFSAVYYPVSILPNWAQGIAAILPTSYVFEGMREVIGSGNFDPDKFFASLALNLIYLGLSIIFLRRSFDKAMKKGLINLY